MLRLKLPLAVAVPLAMKSVLFLLVLLVYRLDEDLSVVSPLEVVHSVVWVPLPFSLLPYPSLFYLLLLLLPSSLDSDTVIWLVVKR